jgi:hypothetical protein
MRRKNSKDDDNIQILDEDGEGAGEEVEEGEDGEQGSRPVPIITQKLARGAVLHPAWYVFVCLLVFVCVCVCVSPPHNHSSITTQSIIIITST